MSKADCKPAERDRHSLTRRDENERDAECTSIQRNVVPNFKRNVLQPENRSPPPFPVSERSEPMERKYCSGFDFNAFETVNNSSEELCVSDDSSDHENEKSIRKEISLDDIYRVRLITLKNRVTRYNTKMTKLKMSNANEQEIRKLQEQIDEIRRVIKERSGTGNPNPMSKIKKKRQPGEQKMPSPDEVFNFIVKNMDGKGTPRDIKEQSSLFPAEVDLNEWFIKNKSIFTLIERNGNIMTVLVYNKHTTYCFDYNFKRDSCNRTECRRYHVCKGMLTGQCTFGRKNCKFSHDFLDENNKKISDDLGYSKLFTSDQICSILRVSFPHLCTTWASSSSCGDHDCIRLHLCPLYVLGKCTTHSDCPKSHDRKSDHNKPIEDAFEMSGMEYNAIFCSTILDAAENTYICHLNLVDKCAHHCNKVHSSIRLPYIWQINLFGTWVTLPKSEDIEEAYANNRDISEKITMVYNGMDLICWLLYDQTIRARVRILSAGEEALKTEARRLSTVSYKQLDHTSSDTTKRQQGETKDGFITQWRWYWKDDDEKWHLFEPDAMQHILEAKFLANQKTYIFSRYNYYFNYTISFTSMCQSNSDTGRVRDIGRRPVFVTGEDVKAKLYPQSLPGVAQVDTTLPLSWMPWDVAQPFELVDIAKNCPSETDTVMTSFFKSIDPGKVKVRDIYRIQNNKLWDLFCSQERTMEANAKRSVRYGKYPVHKQHLFHGTDSEDAVRGICTNNFDPRVSGKSGILYGDGAYFARDAKYSHAYTKGPERYIFMVNVLVGQYTKGDKSYRRPPNKPGSDHELYDSCVNDVEDPSVFVIFDRNQYYPEYLIKYHDV